MSLYSSLNQGFAQSHSQGTNLRNLDTKYQEHGLGADEAAAGVIPQGNHKSKGVENHSLILLAHS
jgi:hypothetical protein